jgi:hypothetical protein
MSVGLATVGMVDEDARPRLANNLPRQEHGSLDAVEHVVVIRLPRQFRGQEHRRMTALLATGVEAGAKASFAPEMQLVHEPGNLCGGRRQIVQRVDVGREESLGLFRLGAAGIIFGRGHGAMDILAGSLPALCNGSAERLQTFRSTPSASIGDVLDVARPACSEE